MWANSVITSNNQHSVKEQHTSFTYKGWIPFLSTQEHSTSITMYITQPFGYTPHLHQTDKQNMAQ